MIGSYQIWYGVTSLVFGVILFFPLRKFMLALSVNKLQRKENRAVTAEEREKLRKRITVIAMVVAVAFAFFYNKVVMLKFFGPAAK